MRPIGVDAELDFLATMRDTGVSSVHAPVTAQPATLRRV
jgi:hypothetical protein